MKGLSLVIKAQIEIFCKDFQTTNFFSFLFGQTFTHKSMQTGNTCTAPTLHAKCEAYSVHNMVACVSLRAENISGILSSFEDEKCLPGVTSWRKVGAISNDFYWLLKLVYMLMKMCRSSVQNILPASENHLVPWWNHCLVVHHCWLLTSVSETQSGLK